jgi:hypothetical protein
MEATNNVALDRFQDLFIVLADLIKRVADSNDPNIRLIRAKVRAEMLELESDMTPIAANRSQARKPQPPWSAIWDSI